MLQRLICIQGDSGHVVPFSFAVPYVSSGLQYIAGLYTSTSPVATEDFVLWNLRASFRVARWLYLWARGENLLAQKYEINAGYPMPRATVMAGVNIHF